MVISKTPLRISFFGGGTDYPDYYRKHGGAVLSTTIDKYIFTTVNNLSVISDHKYKVTYSKLELCQNVHEIVHPSVRECIKFLKMEGSVEVHTVNHLPARTGLGSSSSFTVGFLNALYALTGRTVSKERLAQESIEVEQNLIGERVGSQDQYAAAYGGLNYIQFRENGGSILIKPVVITSERKKELQDSLMLFYTGIARYANEILEEQIDRTKKEKNNEELAEMKGMTEEGLRILTSGEPLQAFGKLLHKTWESKKKLSSAISNRHLDSIYESAMTAGALGGKLLGAGGGGFLLFFVPKHKQDSVHQTLNGCRKVEFCFEEDGSRIIFVGDD